MIIDSLFVTKRLEARAWHREDAQAVFDMFNDDEVIRYIGREKHPSVEYSRAVIDKLLARSRTLGGSYGSWPLIDRESQHFVGIAVLKPLLDRSGRPTEDIEFGCQLVRSEWGKGYATEAARALLHYGFETLGLPILHTVIEALNERSLAVMRRLGMHYTGPTKLYYDLELEHFELTASAWRAATAS